jgi:hypothetical protein
MKVEHISFEQIHIMDESERFVCGLTHCIRPLYNAGELVVKSVEGGVKERQTARKQHLAVRNSDANRTSMCKATPPTPVPPRHTYWSRHCAHNLI